MTQYAIVSDLNRCVGCMSCSVACKIVNDVPIGNFWNKILTVGPNPKFEGASEPSDMEWYYLPIQCQHCASPECVAVCPTQASTKQADGTIQINKEKCIGCQFCVMACPYGVRYLNQEERVVEKCTLCEQQLAQGELPQCVSQCVGLCKHFGDLEADPTMMSFRSGNDTTLADNARPFDDSEVYTLPNVGNNPSFRYILRHKKWQGAV